MVDAELVRGGEASPVMKTTVEDKNFRLPSGKTAVIFGGVCNEITYSLIFRYVPIYRGIYNLIRHIKLDSDPIKCI